MKNFISVCFFLIISFLYTGCYAVYIVVPPDEDIVCDIDQPPIFDPPAPPIHPIEPIIVICQPAPQSVTFPLAFITAQPKPVEPVKQDRREIRVGRGPADQKPAALTNSQRESHSGRNPIVSNPPSQTYSEQSGSRNDGRENTQRPARDTGVKRNIR